MVHFVAAAAECESTTPQVSPKTFTRHSRTQLTFGDSRYEGRGRRLRGCRNETRVLSRFFSKNRFNHRRETTEFNFNKDKDIHINMVRELKSRRSFGVVAIQPDGLATRPVGFYLFFGGGRRAPAKASSRERLQKI